MTVNHDVGQLFAWSVLVNTGVTCRLGWGSGCSDVGEVDLE